MPGGWLCGNNPCTVVVFTKRFRKLQKLQNQFLDCCKIKTFPYLTFYFHGIVIELN